MSEQEELEVTPRQKAAGNICAGAAVILCALFLLLCGVGVIRLDVVDVLSASILFAIAAGFLASGLIQKNAVSVWIAVAFILPAVVEVLVKFQYAEYATLYPLYIAIPAIASCITGLVFRNFKPHFAVIMFFGGLAALFTLQSSNAASWAITAPAVLLFVGLCILYVAIRSYRNKEKEKGKEKDQSDE